MTTSLGENIKFFRIEAGLTQRDFAERLGVTANYLSQIEHARKAPSLKLVEHIADTLNIKQSALFKDDPVFSEMRRLVNKMGLDSLIEELQKLKESQALKV